MENTEEKYVPAARVANEPAAHIVKQALEEQGIPCRVRGELAATAMAGVAAAGPQILVPEPQLQRAKAFLESVEEAHTGIDEENGDE